MVDRAREVRRDPRTPYVIGALGLAVLAGVAFTWWRNSNNGCCEEEEA